MKNAKQKQQNEEIGKIDLRDVIGYIAIIMIVMVFAAGMYDLFTSEISLLLKIGGASVAALTAGVLYYLAAYGPVFKI